MLWHINLLLLAPHGKTTLTTAAEYVTGIIRQLRRCGDWLYLGTRANFVHHGSCNVGLHGRYRCCCEYASEPNRLGTAFCFISRHAMENGHELPAHHQFFDV